MQSTLSAKADWFGGRIQPAGEARIVDYKSTPQRQYPGRLDRQCGESQHWRVDLQSTLSAIADWLGRRAQPAGDADRVDEDIDTPENPAGFTRIVDYKSTPQRHA